MYRWGYYFGTGVMTKPEFKTAFDALESMANYQGDATAKNLSTIRKRIRGLELKTKDDFFLSHQKKL